MGPASPRACLAPVCGGVHFVCQQPACCIIMTYRAGCSPDDIAGTAAAVALVTAHPPGPVNPRNRHDRMAEDTVRCPQCGAEIRLTEAFYEQVRRSVKDELSAQAAEKARAIEAQREALRREREEVEAKRSELDRLVAERLAVERERMAASEKERAAELVRVELEDLEARNEEQARRLAEAQERELELRRRAREVEEREQRMRLEMERRLDEERARMMERLEEEHRLRDMEKDKKIADMLRTIEELRRKGEAGSEQGRGEVLELDLEAMLASRFPADSIEPVPKGVRGADVIQRVCDRAGNHCGAIVWETKRTKAWNDAWIEKLKDDQREVRAEIAVIVTETMPRDIGAFGLIDGVWVASVALAEPLAHVLRSGLLSLGAARRAAQGKGEKMEILYNYLSGPEFKQKVEAIVTTFAAMDADLAREKIAMERLWKKRARQIERVKMNTAAMYGDLQGIIGASLPELRGLELPGGEGDDEV
ncbi:MAG TPA: DUF2130 domain-containing protein [Deltaproteobacteria bacterium]|nr:DUF2130 domain-containing protein [Deltaproteobacteria bacterium]